MHSKQIQAEIDHLMETLNEQYEAVNSRQGIVPRIEIDIMMTTLRNLYEQLHRLGLQQDRSTVQMQQEIQSEKTNVLSDTTVKEEVKAEAPTISEVAPVIAEPINVVPEPVVEIVVEEIMVTKEEIVIEQAPLVLKEETPVPVKMEKPAPAPSKKPIQTAGLFDEVTTVAETYSVKTTTLHERMSSGKTDRSVADNFQSKPLTDLKKSIGINEKFVLVNELFEGNHNLFNQSIDRLNGFTAYDQARRHLFEELAGQMKWNTESKAFGELSDLVRRRFTSL